MVPTTAQEEFDIIQSNVTKHDDWAWAHHQLGRYYEHGMGCQVDMKQAFSHYVKAATIGHTESQCRLGKYYQQSDTGSMTKPCLDQATFWYGKAADNGCALSQTSLGYIYKRQDMLEEATGMFGRAAEQGVDVAQCALARCYAYGKGVEQSVEKSLYWYKQAADQGNSKAMAKYALMQNAHIHQQKGIVKVPADQSPISEAICWPEQTSMRITRAMKHAVVCTQCQKPAGERLSQCCCAVRYCDNACQSAHWIAGHKLECCISDRRKTKRRRIAELWRI
jgi:TPR repeat protein